MARKLSRKSGGFPPVADIEKDATHRLIPSAYADGDDSVLTRLSDDPGELKALFELEGATNDRLLGEAGLLPGITVRELVFGLPYSHIVNAAFTHARPGGNRFNGEDRGAWYAGFSRKTAEVEVAFHRGKELKEIRWKEPEKFLYVDFLADFHGQFHDLRGEGEFGKYLEPEQYAVPQGLARELLEEGSAGIVYPSVRHKGGTCIACFRPALVNNVRKGPAISIEFANGEAEPDIRVVK